MSIVRRALPFLAAAAVAAPLGADYRSEHIHRGMMEALGGDAFGSVATLEFDFAVRVDGREELRRTHLWDRTSGGYVQSATGAGGGACTVYMDLDAPDRGQVFCDGAPIRGGEAAERLERARADFISDAWWLLMPFRWRDRGVVLTYIGPEQSGRTEWDVILVEVPQGAGLAPGDRYWAYVNRRSGRIDKWETLGEDGRPPAQAVWWKDWEEHAGVRFSTRREVEGTGRVVLIENLEVSPDRDPSRFRPPGTVWPSPPSVAVETAASPAPAPAPAPSSVDVPGEPSSAVHRPRDMLLVLNKGSNEAVLLDPVKMEVAARVGTGPNPHEAVIDPQGRRAWVTSYGHSTSGSTISVIDLETFGIADTWDLGEHARPHGMVLDGKGRLWVTSEASGSLLRLDPDRGGEVLRVVETGGEVSHMVAWSPATDKIFVTNMHSGTVTVVPGDGSAPRRIEVGRGPDGIAASPVGRQVWVANRQEDTVAILDAVGESVVGRVESGDMPIRVQFTPDGSRVLVSCARSGEVRLYHAVTREQLQVLKVDNPMGLLVPPSGDRVFVSDMRAGEVRLFDLYTGRLMGKAATGEQPDGLAWVPASR